MSNETAARLAETQKLAAQLRAKADDEVAACLNTLASVIPRELDGIAKSTAQNQPEVTKSLGAQGLAALRRDLADAAEELGADLREAARAIKWPQAVADYSSVNAGKVHSALFDYLYGARVNRLAAVFKRHGFDIRERDGHPQSLILPQYLYTENVFVSVAEALDAAGKAERAVASAKAADDEDIVGSLWDDSGSSA